MPRYLLELYVPRGQGLEEAAARAQLVQEKDVRYVRTMFVAEDETCFHVFEAASRDVLLEAASRSGLVEARITEAVESESREGA
ncbi:MAG: hypothetical protein C5B48_03520 [Candidatus Rokuibacteriota bacterium]|nr:MAG: hypothetical protein C5B48_03520 [Candidatus Rokubacteria bacterium]